MVEVEIECKWCKQHAVKPKRSFKFCSTTCRDESRKATARRWKASNPDKNKAITKRWKQSNKAHISKYNQKYFQENCKTDEYRQKVRERMKIYKENNVDVKIATACRNRIRKFYSGQRSTCDILECTHEFLCEWFLFLNSDLQLKDHGYTGWHMDHVVPVASFNMMDEEHISLCFHWSNLQPLDALKNHSKLNKILINDINEHHQKVKEFCELTGTKLPNLSKIIEILSS